MNKQYARTYCTSGIDITALTEYPIIDWKDEFFYILDDVGEKRLCLPLGCANIGDNNWEIIDMKESEAMNSILVGKDAQKVAVMDWAEEMSDRGFWVDLSWDADVRRCVAKVGRSGHSRAIMSASGGTEITARIELMRAWAVIDNE